MSLSKTESSRSEIQTENGQLSAEAIAAVERVILMRRSVRGFSERRVDPDLMDRIFSVAQSAPSNCNVQPWRVYVGTGQARDRIRDAMVADAVNGSHPNPDFESGIKFEGIYRTHQVECAAALYGEMGIDRADRAGRALAGLRNFQLFDAPHVAFIGMSKGFGPIVAMDVGMYVQSLMLLMTAHGIASCPMGSLAQYPELVRSEFDVPEDIGILCGVVFGYEDGAVPANRTRTTRAQLSDNTVFKG